VKKIFVHVPENDYMSRLWFALSRNYSLFFLESFELLSCTGRSFLISITFLGKKIDKVDVHEGRQLNFGIFHTGVPKFLTKFTYANCRLRMLN
jgi:hypothetical protein